MRKFKQFLSLLLAFTLCFAFAGCKKSEETKDSDKNTKTDSSSEDTYHIVASFYPMHILLMNLTDGIDGVTESSMSDPNMGCIHDHTFTTEDLKKIEGADVYVENGLGLEAFNDKIKETYPDTPIIEAAKNVTNYPKGGEENGMDGNAHVWTDLNNYILEVQYVSEQLQKLDPAHKEAYAANEKTYVDQLTQLANDYKEQLSAVSNKTALVLDETLPSLCMYLNMTMMEIETDHEQESLSASDLKDTIAKMKEDGVNAIFIGKDSSRQNAEMIAKETNATIYELNTCMVGVESKDAYLNDMKENFELISKIK